MRRSFAFVVVAVLVAGSLAIGAPKKKKSSKPDAGTSSPRAVKALKFGTLELKIRGTAVVFLDDQELGPTPLPPRKLLEGSHKLRFVNEKLGLDETQTVEIRGGQIKTLEISFES